jgi:hypothetical protein
VHELPSASRVDEALEDGTELGGAWDVELPGGLHEVDLRVDVPEDAPHRTGSSLELSR